MRPDRSREYVAELQRRRSATSRPAQEQTHAALQTSSQHDLPSSKEEEQLQVVRDLFNECLKGKIDRVPPANVPAHLEGVTSISLLPPRTTEGGSLNIVVFYTGENGRPTSKTFSIHEDNEGVISGGIPRELEQKGVTRSELSFEVMTFIDKLQIDTIHKTDSKLDVGAIAEMAQDETGVVFDADELAIFPHTDPTSTVADLPGEGKERKGRVPSIDMSRYELLLSRPDLLFIVTNKVSGLNGYFAAVFPDRVVFENTNEENAAYVVDIPVPISVHSSIMELPRDQRFTKQNVQDYIDVHLRGIFGDATSRLNLRATRAPIRVVHAGNWQQRISAYLDKRAA